MPEKTVRPVWNYMHIYGIKNPRVSPPFLQLKKLSSTCFGASEEDSGKDQPSPSLVLHTQSQAQRTQLGIAVFFKIKKLSPLLLFESSG